ncbi:MAG: hypothetical protein QOJ99_1033 [Bryobacterales bacterium]|jgi:hypothetical protein|nr:hypothetical protein [Bryobacterales bacterium]
MLNVINTKLLAAILAVLAGIASYFAYEKHKQETEEKKAQEMLRKPTRDEQKTIDSLKGWGKSVQEYKSK